MDNKSTSIKQTELSNPEQILNIAAYQSEVTTLGPGKRFTIWVQGCPFECEACTSPDWIPFKKAKLISIETMAMEILSDKQLDGITISGGEPFLQAGRLAKLLHVVKQINTELTVIIFSGFTRKQLVWKEARELLKQADLLIDGQYVDKLNDGVGLRGSSNQQFHFLSHAFSANQQQDIKHQHRNLSFQIRTDGVMMSGIPNKDFNW